MKLSLSALLLATSLGAATYAHADAITSATIYTGVTDYNNADDAANQTANHATFSISGTGINYNTGASAAAAATIAGFLNNPTFSNVAGSFTSTVAPTTLEIIIKGTLTLTAGEVLALTHDDGASLALNGVEVITSTGPTVAKTSTYTEATAGTYSFVLNYAANNLEPSVLNFKAGGVNVGATPEPSSFVLLGSGLVTAAGFIRRRISAGNNAA